MGNTHSVQYTQLIGPYLRFAVKYKQLAVAGHQYLLSVVLGHTTAYYHALFYATHGMDYGLWTVDS